MNEETLNLIFFFSENSNYLDSIYQQIKYCIDLGRSGYLGREENVSMNELKNSGKYLEKLTDYKEWLDKKKIDLVEEEISDLKKYLEYLCNKIRKKEFDSDDESPYGYQGYESITNQLLYNFNQILQHNMFIRLKIRREISAILRSFSDEFEFSVPEINEQIQEIQKLYGELKNDLKGLSHKFIQSSEISFRYAITFFMKGSVDIYTSEKGKEQRKSESQGYYAASLFMVFSAYEKIISSIAYSFDSSMDERYINLKLSRDVIEQKNKSLFDRIVKSDRIESIDIARKLRNAETHRINRLMTAEIKGYIMSVVLELNRILKIYKMENPDIS